MGNFLERDFDERTYVRTKVTRKCGEPTTHLLVSETTTIPNSTLFAVVNNPVLLWLMTKLCFVDHRITVFKINNS